MNEAVEKQLPYHPNARKLTQLFIVGFIASMVAFLGTFLLSLFGATIIDLPTLFGAWVFVEPSVTWVGTALLFLVGSLFYPVAFDYLAFREILTNQRWLKGFAFAVILWIIAEAILKPLGDFGFFSRRMANPVGHFITSLVAWLIYAWTLESLLRARFAHELEVPASTDREAA
jgi:hypothetical protein